MLLLVYPYLFILISWFPPIYPSMFRLEATGFKAIDFIQSGMWWLILVLEFKKSSEITLVAQGTLSRLFK